MSNFAQSDSNAIFLMRLAFPLIHAAGNLSRADLHRPADPPSGQSILAFERWDGLPDSIDKLYISQPGQQHLFRIASAVI